MSQRPNFWIHRTRRFWIGLTLLILLTGFILSIGYFACMIGYRKSKPPPKAGWPAGRTYHMAGLQSGGILYHRTDYPIHLMSRSAMSKGTWSFIWEKKMGFKLLPQSTYVDRLGLSHPDEPYLFIPLWPLVPLLATIWVVQMFRTEKRELKQYGQAPPDP